jgi:predicted DsbA family dithiol-disulfide isomerase
MLASASTLALELAPFEQCLDEPSVTSVIQRDLELARQLGVSATPGFGLGRPGPDGSVAVTTLIRGAQPLEVFETAIDDVRNE